jgi:hypothetical protein
MQGEDSDTLCEIWNHNIGLQADSLPKFAWTSQKISMGRIGRNEKDKPVLVAKE